MSAFTWEATARATQRLALTQVVMANSITSLRAIGLMEWNSFVEGQSRIELVLRDDYPLPIPGDAGVLTQAIHVGVAVAGGVLVFLISALILRVGEVDDLRKALVRRFRP